MSRMTHKRAMELGGKSSWSKAECREVKFEMSRARGRELDLEYALKTAEAVHAAAEERWEACKAERISGLKRLDEKDAQIKALADALELLRRNHCTMILEEREAVEAALRLVGRLK